MSIDGSVTVGGCDNLPVKWTGTTPTVLPFVAGSTNASVDEANLNGSILIGASASADGNGHTDIWTNGAPTLLTELAGSTSSHGSGISSDGTVIVGTVHLSSDTTGLGQAYRAKNGVMALIPFIPGTPEFSETLGVSADGNRVVLFAKGFGTSVWDANTNTQILLSSQFTPLAISGDGNWVVGATSNAAVFNVPTSSTTLLSTILSNRGIQLGDFDLDVITAVSRDGKVLVGNGRATSTGVAQAWVVSLL